LVAAMEKDGSFPVPGVETQSRSFSEVSGQARMSQQRMMSQSFSGAIQTSSGHTGQSDQASVSADIQHKSLKRKRSCVDTSVLMNPPKRQNRSATPDSSWYTSTLQRTQYNDQDNDQDTSAQSAVPSPPYSLRSRSQTLPQPNTSIKVNNEEKRKFKKKSKKIHSENEEDVVEPVLSVSKQSSSGALDIQPQSLQSLDQPRSPLSLDDLSQSPLSLEHQIQSQVSSDDQPRSPLSLDLQSLPCSEMTEFLADCHPLISSQRTSSKTVSGASHCSSASTKYESCHSSPQHDTDSVYSINSDSDFEMTMRVDQSQADVSQSLLEQWMTDDEDDNQETHNKRTVGQYRSLLKITCLSSCDTWPRIRCRDVSSLDPGHYRLLCFIKNIVISESDAGHVLEIIVRDPDDLQCTVSVSGSQVETMFGPVTWDTTDLLQSVEGGVAELGVEKTCSSDVMMVINSVMKK